jgi:hypothetical protein
MPGLTTALRIPSVAASKHEAFDPWPVADDVDGVRLRGFVGRL